MFRKTTLACLVAVCMCGSAALAQETQGVPEKAKVGIIHLRDTLTERPESFSFSLTSLTSMGNATALSNVIASLNAAAKDTTLKGVVLDMSDF